jgi:hypothetical protein
MMTVQLIVGGMGIAYCCVCWIWEHTHKPIQVESEAGAS